MNANKLKGYGFKVPDSKDVSVEDAIYANRANGIPKDDNMFLFEHGLDHEIDKLTDVDKGAKLLSEHIGKSNIAIVVDYDADGITSGVTLFKGLNQIFYHNKKNLVVFVNRRKDGNGFKEPLVKRILDHHKKNKIDLIVSADHGSADNEAFKIFEKEGIPTIITDHHLITNGYPENATVFINPQRDDSTYIKSISGCCVAFLLLVKTYKTMFKATNFKDLHLLLPYVGISTVTDVMSLKEPYNRHLVRLGLRQINSLKDRKWIYIKNAIGVKGLISVKDLGFKIGPLINSGNATNTENEVFEMLIESADNGQILDEKINSIVENNNLRKTTTNKIFKEQIKTIDNKYGISVLIETELSINGKVAPQVGSKYNRPTVCFNDTGLFSGEKVPYYKGSGRGMVKGYNILEVFTAIAEEDSSVFRNNNEFGGHEGAIGCAVMKDKFDQFKEMFDRHSKIALDKIDHNDVLDVDMFIPDYMLTTDLANSINKIGPYGKDWVEPIFVSELKVRYVQTFAGICSMTFTRKNGGDISAMYYFNDDGNYNIGNIKSLMGKKICVAFNIKVECYRKRHSLKLEIVKIGGVIGKDNSISIS